MNKRDWKVYLRLIKMPKFGRGLNREVVAAVNRGLISEPFSVATVRQFAMSNNWDVSENYLIVCLANAAAETHSHTFKKYFNALGNGQYRIRQEFKGANWL
jgi:hypothetical protein